MTFNEALTKAAKLLRLGQSANQHEAALAISRAQAIMERFKIDANMLDAAQTSTQPDEPIKNFGEDPLDAQSGTWRWRLALPLAKANQCKLYLTGGRPALIGRPSDVQTVRYFYSWLVKEIDSLTRRECSGNGRTYSNNFRLGCVETVARRITEMQKQTQESAKAEAAQTQNSMALIRLNQSLARIEQRAADVEKWAADNMRLRRSSGSRSRFDSSAREHGRTAGQSIRISAPKAGMYNRTAGALAG